MLQLVTAVSSRYLSSFWARYAFDWSFSRDLSSAELNMLKIKTNITHSHSAGYMYVFSIKLENRQRNRLNLKIMEGAYPIDTWEEAPLLSLSTCIRPCAHVYRNPVMYSAFDCLLLFPVKRVRYILIKLSLNFNSFLFSSWLTKSLSTL